MAGVAEPKNATPQDEVEHITIHKNHKVKVEIRLNLLKIHEEDSRSNDSIGYIPGGAERILIHDHPASLPH